MRRFAIEIQLFLLCLLTFGYFHQGGGWGQNARFAMVRAIVESGTLSIDSYLIYTGEELPGRGLDLIRVPVHDGEFTWHGQSCVLAWVDQARTGFVPVTGRHREGQPVAAVQAVAVSGDVTFRRGHFFPAKAPGVSLLAVPVYFVIYHIERFIGLNPDHWRTLTYNAWLTSVLSVGLLCAIGCVIFYRVTLRLSGGKVFASALTTLAFAFGTQFFPFATMLQDHSVFATELLIAFYFMDCAKTLVMNGDARNRRRARLMLCLSGVCLGLGCATNYLALVVALPFLVYLVCTVHDRGAWFWFVLGMIGPIPLICAYNLACFGALFTSNVSELNSFFRSRSGFLSVLTTPQWDVLLAILFSPFRGLFLFSPILLMGIVGLWHMIRVRSLKAEALLFVAIALVFLTFHVCYIDWMTGWTTEPRYLTPVVPLLMVPAVFGFLRYFKTACALLVVSAAVQLLCTAVDPQSPLGVSFYGQVPGRPEWTYNQLTEYELPLFFTGQARPILEAKVEEIVSGFDKDLTTKGYSDEVRKNETAKLRARLLTDIQGGNSSFFTGYPSSLDKTRLALANVRGPVSANPIGIYEGGYATVFPLDSNQAKWNSFNLGELLFPQMRLSLLPLLLINGALAAWILTGAYRLDNASEVLRSR